MKRIDLHIHTLATPLDDEFKFAVDVLKDHVINNGLSMIAITNHNLFDSQNFKEVCEEMPEDVCVLPGIEVSVKGFHVLVIANPTQLDFFDKACNEVAIIGQEDDGISIEEFNRLFGDGSYIVIPHYKKKPSIQTDDLIAMNDVVTALEVTSEKKWEYEHNRVEKPVVIFSDFRCAENSHSSLGKYTYVALGEITFESLRLAFYDAGKFAITERVAHMELAPNLFASMGLNVVVGARSSGKTYFLDSLYNSCAHDDVVYIKQFSIVKDAEEKAFQEKLLAEETAIKSDYYEPMNRVSAAVEELPSREATAKSIKDYLANLIEYADTSARDDEFSKCPIYSEARLAKVSSDAEQKVVEALLVLLDENPLSKEIEEGIGKDVLVQLFRIALGRFKAKELKRRCAERANEIAKEVRKNLTLESRRPPCPESPLLEAAKRAAYIKRLASLRTLTKSAAIVSNKAIGKFNRITKRVPYKDARALKAAIGANTNMSGILQLDDIDFVESILCANGVTDICRAFFDMDVTLENDRGEAVSGGQRAEYLFFKELERASNHDIVLIDEPESSFDNPFLNKEIAGKLKQISKKATVFIATHNNVLGVSIKPDGIIFTDVEEDKHRVFTCDSGDEFMTSAEGKTIKRSDVLLKLMEAGPEAYAGRKPYYGLA